MPKRKFPRIKLKEVSCIIHDGTKYRATGEDERETFALILDISYGGASIKTNISCQEGASFVLQIPKMFDLESFSIKSEVVRSNESDDSRPFHPRYLIALKFIDPAAMNRIQKFYNLLQNLPKS